MEIGFLNNINKEVVLIILVVLIGGLIMFGKLKKRGKKIYGEVFQNNKKDINAIPQLISDDDEYIGNKWLIENAIKEEDWDRLYAMKEEDDILKHEDLIKMINIALKNK